MNKRIITVLIAVFFIFGSLGCDSQSSKEAEIEKAKQKRSEEVLKQLERHSLRGKYVRETNNH